MSVASVAVMLIINALQIFFRYVLNSAFAWVFPLTMLLFIWMTFLGAFVVYRQKKDIIIHFITDRLPAKGQDLLLLLMNLLTMGMLVWILSQLPTMMRSQASVMEIIPLPRYVQAIPLFIGVAGILLEYLVATVAVSKNLFRPSRQMG